MSHPSPATRSWFLSETGSPSGSGPSSSLLALPAAAGVDLLGWIAAPQVWLEAGKAVKAVSKAYAGLPGWSAWVDLPLRPDAGGHRGRGPEPRPADVPAGLHGRSSGSASSCWLAGALRVHRPDAGQAGGDGDLLVAGADRRGGLPVALLAGLRRGEPPARGWPAGSRPRPGRSGSSRPRS